MFTGIVQEIGSVRRASRSGGYLRVEVAYDEGGGRLRRGDSMAVDGVCLTATSVGRGQFGADLSAETRKASTLGSLKVGDRVNLERPLTPADPLGGHIVLGHVDGTGRIRRVTPSPGGLRIAVQASRPLVGLLVEKGSVAVDGISLTVGSLGGDSFEVLLIPETRERTTLGTKGVGGTVNLEADYLAKLVRRFLETGSGAGGRLPAGGQGED